MPTLPFNQQVLVSHNKKFKSQFNSYVNHSSMFQSTCQTTNTSWQGSTVSTNPIHVTAAVPKSNIVRYSVQFYGLRLCLRNVQKSDNVCASVRRQWPPSGVSPRFLTVPLQFASRPDSILLFKSIFLLPFIAVLCTFGSSFYYYFSRRRCLPLNVSSSLHRRFWQQLPPKAFSSAPKEQKARPPVQVCKST